MNYDNVKNIDNYIEKSFRLLKSVGDSTQKTLFFEIGERKICPGQFFMLNYLGQKPISVSHYDGNIVGFTIQNRGECTEKMINANINDYFGLIGPLGNKFSTDNVNSALIIGGGIGIAPLYFLANNLIKQKKDVDIIFGARTKGLLEFTLDIKDRVDYFTDDGSFGKKGFVTEPLTSLTKDYDLLYLCGPEKMMKRALDIAPSNINKIELSMERYMKCGVGICGSCVLDDIGARVCADGPVFSKEEILASKEFGLYHRDGNGTIIY